jgi:probable HAF family extracellular repeat protein
MALSVGRLLTVTASSVLAFGVTQAGTALAATRPSGTAPTVLASPAGGSSAALGMNRWGEVVGTVSAGGEASAVLWHRYDSSTALPGPLVIPVALNDRGHVIGWNIATDDGYLVRDGRLTVLHWPSGGVEPRAINNRDQVVGYIDAFGGGHDQAFLWQDGVFTLLPGPADTDVEAVDVNDRGQVLLNLFRFSDNGSEVRGVVWNDGAPTDIGTLGDRQTSPVAINNRGEVVGYTTDADGVVRPFVWSRGRMTDLLAGTAETRGWAAAINDSGVVVGQAGLRAVVWQGGWMTRVGPPAGTSEAVVVNNRGDVGGIYYADGTSPEAGVRAFSWRSGRLTVFDSLPGSWGVTVSGIDDRGRLAGTITTVLGTDWADHAVVWGATVR